MDNSVRKYCNENCVIKTTRTEKFLEVKLQFFFTPPQKNI